MQKEPGSQMLISNQTPYKSNKEINAKGAKQPMSSFNRIHYLSNKEINKKGTWKLHKEMTKKG